MLYGMRRHSSFRYDDSPESNKYPEDVCTNDVFKDESGHPISNNFTHRIHSQIAISEVGALQSFLLQQDPRDFQMMENMNEIPSFYVPRSGDPEKISFNRKNLPRESKVDSSTNFSYPIPPTQPRPETPPEVPGPIMSRGRPRSVTAFGLSNNRYAPSKNKKKGPNPKVYSILRNSSARKSMKQKLASQPNLRKKEKRISTLSIDSTDIPDPFNQTSTSNVPKTPERSQGNYKVKI
ncbi:hypothetical protein BY996DRAFT_7078141 [Phakopsora pachyrhizi]|nr:hypothetical protein BY996DRAFT_7078141 [Phakopsora pachyrhizi]